MPKTKVVFYRETNGKAPVFDWLNALAKHDRKAWANCYARIRLLADFGHELRRPSADYLRDDIRELRAKHGRVQYRILYFFHGHDIAVLAHAIVKEGSAVPDADIERAIARKKAFEADPRGHTYDEETEDE